VIADQAEALFINQATVVSTIAATVLNFGPVPEKKLWAIQAASYFPDAAETRTVQWCIVNPAGTALYAVSVPLSIALSTSIFFPLLTEGNEFALLPGQYLQVRRDVATAGSAMTLLALFVEMDMPLYHYTEPLQRLRERKSASTALQNLTGTGPRIMRSLGGVIADRGAPPPKVS